MKISLIKNTVTTTTSESNETQQINQKSCMDMDVILASDENSVYFIGLKVNFWSLYEFLGPAKFNLNHWGSKQERPK